METKVRGRASKLVAGSSQATIIDSAKVGSSKRDAEAKIYYEGSKRQKTNEASRDDLVMLWSLVKERFSQQNLLMTKKEHYRERNGYFHARRERISIVKRDSDFDVG
nr:hypothetical protein [Tanacetum cinerariifolium]